MRNPSQVFSRGRILDHLWNCSEAPGEDTVTSHIKGLRRKLTAAGAPSDVITTVYGVGYRLSSVVPPKPQSADSTSPSTKRVSQQKKTREALGTLWHSVKPQHLERLALIKRAHQALQQDQLTHDLRQAAAQAAHSLTGALGVFGLKSGSDLASAIEKILQGDVPVASEHQQLSELVNALAEQLHQALSRLEQAKSRQLPPLLVLIDENLPLLRQLEQALQSQELRVDIALNEATLHTLQRKLKAQSSLEHTNGHQHLEHRKPEETVPNVVLFNCSLVTMDNVTLMRLSKLINQIPSLLVLVSSAEGSVASRVRAAQLGSHSFLHNPDVSTLLESILEVRSHFQKSANTVLAVDDDPQVLEALRLLLEPEGLQLVTLNHTIDFWSTLQASSPDLLLLDIEMPEFNGIELCRAIRQAPAWNQLPIIFFTAHGDANIKTAALRAGANDLVEKSLADSDLLVRLCDQLRRSQLQQTIATLVDKHVLTN
ncbi:response regulator [Leptolyngbya cf. ectocarpi LEGE 11479]|uniref:Response regulator n=1 Tax=Leptolyngbya cf. ectocarpi LEGE 11479 TaxID=1828722 RepID=A0A929A0U3_LEPEC|nr:response regulator [Leptolyngbya cf. ectocarpi LEGE 11479]